MLALIDTHTVDRGVHHVRMRSGAEYRWDLESAIEERDDQGWRRVEEPRHQIIKGALMAYLGRVMRS